MKTVVFQNDNLYEWSITPGPGLPPQRRGTAGSVNKDGGRERGAKKNIASHESRQNTTLKGQFVMGISGTSGQLYKCMPHHTECGPNIHTPTYNNNLYARAAVKLFFLLLFRVSICLCLSQSLHCVRRFRRSWNNSNPRRLIYRVITIATAGEFWFFFPTGRN